MHSSSHMPGRSSWPRQEEDDKHFQVKPAFQRVQSKEAFSLTATSVLNTEEALLFRIERAGSLKP